MGNRLSKEQEQCFCLIQQLFKAAGCLPAKGFLHLEYGEKQGRAPLIVKKNLDKKRKEPMLQARPFMQSTPAAASNMALPGELSQGAGVPALTAWLGHPRMHTRSASGPAFSAKDWQGVEEKLVPLASFLHTQCQLQFQPSCTIVTRCGHAGPWF